MGLGLKFCFMGSTTRDVGERIQELRRILLPRELTELSRPKAAKYNTFEELDANINASELEELVQATLHSSSDLCLDFSSEIVRPYLVTFYLLGGKGYLSAYQAVVGPLRATIPLNQFRLSSPTMLGPEDEPPTWEEMLDQSGVGWDYESAYRIFAELVGLNNDRMRALGVEHAIGYVEHREAHGASMIYHADIDGFALDFEVLHHRYHKGSTSFILYSDDREMPSEEVLEEVRNRDDRHYWPISREIEEYTDLYLRNYLHHTKERLHKFFQRIDDEAIAYFRGLSSEELAFKVELAAEETGWIWMPATAGDGGAVVGPFHEEDGMTIRNLIVFYERLLDMYEDERKERI